MLRHARPVLIPWYILARSFRFALYALENHSPVLIAIGLLGLLRGFSSFQATRRRFYPEPASRK
jgi:hypothetical protein